MSKFTRNSFETVYKNIALPLMKFIVKKVGGRQDAVDEVFSRTIIATWQAWNSFNNKSSYFTWICRIALNKMADYYREEIHRESVFVAPLLEEFASASINELSPTERMALDELRSATRACLSLLPKEKKRLLFLRYWKQMTIKQIATQLGLSERAVEGKLYRARRKLDQIISVEHPDILPNYIKKEKA